MGLDNNSSECMFIGKRNLGAVIAGDEQELRELGGSFGAIAGRMSSIVAAARGYLGGRDFDEKVRIVSYVDQLGKQECPFGCTKDNLPSFIAMFEETEWSDVVIIESKKTKRRLTINSGTVHLARVHHLLEKDNPYGISAKEFYEGFM